MGGVRSHKTHRFDTTVMTATSNLGVTESTCADFVTVCLGICIGPSNSFRGNQGTTVGDCTQGTRVTHAHIRNNDAHGTQIKKASLHGSRCYNARQIVFGPWA